MADYEYAVELKGIYKAFEGVHALEGVRLAVKPGEVHALMGENGAGKSTLIKVLSGAHLADAGEVWIKGVKTEIRNTKDANDRGIAVIYQEFALMPHMTVAENIFIDEFGGKKHRWVDWKKLNERAKDALGAIGFGDIDPRVTVKELSVAYQQVVEICKALTRKSEILVLDEPTAVLTNREVDKLFGLIRDMRRQGVAIIYISHRLEEIFRIADRITVYKDGRYVDTVETKDVDDKALVSMMIGRDLASFFPVRDERQTIGDVILKAEHIQAGKAVRDVSFELHEGEVLGLSGLVGAGRTETVRAILGVDNMEEGTVWLRGGEVHLKSAKNAFDKGIGFLPEDRKNQGVLLRLPIKYNITFSCIAKITTFGGWLRKKAETAFAQEMRDKVGIKTNDINNPVSSLSGGNQQKVAIARILASDSRVLILDEPTRGVDVGAKMEIFKLINELIYQNYSVLMISSEMVEIIGMCDRAIVFREGRTVGELKKEELTEEALIHYAMGIGEE
ncbi:MAG: sugar ABC transporter ATP-binding protein [Clostridiales Family XIII bacterium]|jgi:ribose transport system ATP-binding protein|nr:sugar ABC transporter ATP-binding protein [Clostridiales Family XIII bacterium]